LDDAFGVGAMMQTAIEFGSRPESISQEPVLAEQMNHGDAAEAAAKPPEKFAPIDESRILCAELKGPLLGAANVARGRVHCW
jgi:hypothetical protein